MPWLESKLYSGICAKTDLPFEFDTSFKKNPFKPSIDRIDSSKGYTKDNCQLVCWAYNIAKFMWPESVVLKMAIALVLKHSENRLSDSYVDRTVDPTFVK